MTFPGNQIWSYEGTVDFEFGGVPVYSRAHAPRRAVRGEFHAEVVQTPTSGVHRQIREPKRSGAFPLAQDSCSTIPLGKIGRKLRRRLSGLNGRGMSVNQAFQIGILDLRDGKRVLIHHMRVGAPNLTIAKQIGKKLFLAAHPQYLDEDIAVEGHAFPEE